MVAIIKRPLSQKQLRRETLIENLFIFKVTKNVVIKYEFLSKHTRIQFIQI